MWQVEDFWSDLRPGDKWWMGVSMVLGVTGGLICITSLTVLIGSGQLLSSVPSDRSILAEAHESGSGEGPTDVLFSNEDGSSAESNPNMVVVDVSGGVNIPGLYQLANGSRVGDAIEQAGGLATSAATRQIAQEVNLAALIQDGQKIFIPTSDDLMRDSPGFPVSTENRSTQSSGTVLDLVSINTASLSQLDALPGIGEKRAEAIINGRPYLSIDELVSKGAVTAKVLDEIKTLISL